MEVGYLKHVNRQELRPFRDLRSETERMRLGRKMHVTFLGTTAHRLRHGQPRTFFKKHPVASRIPDLLCENTSARSLELPLPQAFEYHPKTDVSRQPRPT